MLCKFLKNGKLTNTVVCTNESEYCHITTSLMTLARARQKTAVLWLRTYVLVLVLTYSPEYSLPQPKKLPVLWLRTYVLVLVLVLSYSSEYSLPQHRKLAVFMQCRTSKLMGRLHAHMQRGTLTNPNWVGSEIHRRVPPCMQKELCVTDVRCDNSMHNTTKRHNNNTSE